MEATFLIMLAVGLAIGLLSGLLGVGGGTIMVPVFRLVFGMSPISSTATSLFTIIPTSASGAASHIRKKTCVPKLGLAMGAGGACTSPLGVWASQMSPGWLVMLAVALVVGYSAITMLRKAMACERQAPKQGTLKAFEEDVGSIPSGQVGTSSGNANQEAREALQSSIRPPDIYDAENALAKGFLIGIATGFASGYVGLGGGFLMVPLMVSTLGLPMRLASGTSLVAIMILAIPGSIMQFLLGNIDFLAGIAVACGSIPGAIAGSRLVTRIPERTLRFIFAGFLGVAAILLVMNELGFLG